ncbi:MAG: hypothetical protein IJ737_06925 [Ruminococcus sp.]|nr:hypothetical protein [Ruminococcus sp.]
MPKKQNVYAEPIKAYIKEHSADELADIIGAYKRSVQRWAAGDCIPNEHFRQKLRELLDIPNEPLKRSEQDMLYAPGSAFTILDFNKKRVRHIAADLDNKVYAHLKAMQVATGADLSEVVARAIEYAYSNWEDVE